MLREAASDDFDQIYALMTRSFPSEELRSADAARELLVQPNYHLLKVQNTDQKLTGFFAYWTFSDFYFLEHFAVDPSTRGQGLGTMMLYELLQRLAGDWLLEVEAPKKLLARRRIQFYERCGFIAHSFGYNQPLMQRTAKMRAVPLKIMTNGTNWTLPRLITAKKQIMADVYSCAQSKSRQDA